MHLVANESTGKATVADGLTYGPQRGTDSWEEPTDDGQAFIPVILNLWLTTPVGGGCTKQPFPRGHLSDILCIRYICNNS